MWLKRQGLGQASRAPELCTLSHKPTESVGKELTNVGWREEMQDWG